MTGPDDRPDDPTAEFSSGSDWGDDDPLDLLADEFAGRCRRGEAPSVEAFAAEHPEHADRLRELLPAVAMMEQLKRRSGSGRGREPAAHPVPEQLGGFRIVRELGRGGMGVVYEAIQEPLGRPIALKVMHHAQGDARRLLRFRREAMAVAQLHHTNIVPIFAVGDHEGLPYFAMQYIRGEGLDALIARWRGDASDAGGKGGGWHDAGRWRFAARVAMDAALALQHAHDQGVLHRDIKPANLLIDESDAVWVTDFGLAKLAGQDDLTHSGDVIGTLRYLAPEALEGQSGPRGDVYSLGLTLYEMLTLSPPFGDAKPSEMIQRVGAGRLTRPRLIDPAIPGDLETVALKATAREPGHRYASAGDLAEDLRRFLDDRPIRARRASAIERAWRWGRRNRALASLMATAVAALALAAVVGWAGMIRTAEARDLAEKNARTSFEIIENLINTLATEEENSSRDPAPGDMGGPPPGPPGGPGGPGMAGSPEARRGRAASAYGKILETIRDSYHRVDRRKGAGPATRGQAALVFFRLGCLRERLGEGGAAERDCGEALGLLDGLTAGPRPDSRALGWLARLPDMVDPRVPDAAAFDRVDRRLRRIDALLARHPSDADARHARTRVRLRLGQALQAAGRPEPAEAELRAAVEQAKADLAALPADANRRVDLLDARSALGTLLAGQGRLTPAWNEVAPCFAEFEVPGSGPVSSVLVAERLERLADEFRRAGQYGRADELNRQADVIDPREPLGGPGPGPGRGPGWDRGGRGFGPRR